MTQRHSRPANCRRRLQKPRKPGWLAGRRDAILTTSVFRWGLWLTAWGDKRGWSVLFVTCLSQSTPATCTKLNSRWIAGVLAPGGSHAKMSWIPEPLFCHTTSCGQSVGCSGVKWNAGRGSFCSLTVKSGHLFPAYAVAEAATPHMQSRHQCNTGSNRTISTAKPAHMWNLGYGSLPNLFKPEVVGSCYLPTIRGWTGHQIAMGSSGRALLGFVHPDLYNRHRHSRKGL